MSRTAELRANLDAVQERIAAAAARAGRAGDGVRLVVVTKGHPAEDLTILHQLGVRDLGESYVAEALEKRAALAGLPDLHWHMIGHVQSRKTGDVAAHFDLVHSVDSLRLAGRLSRAAEAAGRSLPALLEVNPGGEASKHGWPVHDAAAWAAALPEIETVLQLPNLHIRGLMCMAPQTETPDQARPYFTRTRALLAELAGRFPGRDWSQLSMGMSSDFEAAIAEGATLLRVGSAILGARPT
ncbi:MAG: YggS family pyridoxal phosphate-dependent enzyme [Anaerolineales bacterium]|nr:YggS family pyridoxal phosphate-dependent enzyme [Anaerolineales bacterium]